MPLPPSSLFSDVIHLASSVVRNLPGCPHDAPLKPPTSRERVKRDALEESPDLYAVWLASRRIAENGTEHLPPAAQRPFSLQNLALACTLSKRCAPELLSCLWDAHPFRISLMVTLDVVRGIFPAFRGYSQAVMIDELQRNMTSGNFTLSHVLHQGTMELVRMSVEAAIDNIATSNENIVHNSARFLVERRQLEQRLRLDVPTLSDPLVRDLLQESDTFVRSFNGFSAFGVFSPFDAMRLLTLVSEVLTHLWVLSSLTFGGTPLSIVFLSVAVTVLPSMLSWLTYGHDNWDCPNGQLGGQLAAKQEAMRGLAHSDAHRPEILLFDLGPWILKSWSRARKSLLGLERRHHGGDNNLSFRPLSRVYLNGMFSAFHNVPLLLVLSSSSTSVGTFTLYRSTLQSLLLTAEALLRTLRMAFQGVFLMGAFCAATALKPRLQPDAQKAIPYSPSGVGMAIDAQNLSFSYPGSRVPALHNITLTVEAGETLAIVGYNGSGKTTLANVLLRIYDFESGSLRVNGVDIQRLDPRDFHAHASAVFQGFSKFSTSVKGNVGIGFVPEMDSADAVSTAIELAGAADLVHSLPEGVRTRLDGDGLNRSCEACCGDGPASHTPHGLSGGEWQRIAISRAFMRARRPEVELLVFDEPTSSLDAHAQKHVFDTIEKISRSPDGDRTKTVIFITHRLATARRADKIAMMENGTIIEFGTHEQLLSRNGRYASLYHASV
ncbi:P-loop containing nucleoside triphosphate hydrolase protein [Dichomitus squalens LYAD-421 SS1]|uniref:P-loop containing nucleoside triphosphate hydrolase protein n=1 Tax=Dichomitus squalens (strain LYAD-421) TaxID=732165 RepID=R7SZZ6_DICSQ|nr:P-loop containing nucleoside triphosphate hydrolase protein [Dichomitus squalens LYAD-421 SS1]EJF61295.1 P-loop containing nucleoside triphosphate hydrolase protein [Dichomitus squalens LYAD-421 SS1]